MIDLFDAFQTLSQLQWLGTLNIPPVQENNLNPKYLRKVSS